MKNIFFYFIFMTCSIWGNELSSGEPNSIAKIYTMAQQDPVINMNYPLYHQTGKQDKWVSVTTAWNTFIEATVDEKNNYIYILDEGTGGGSFSTQAAMWKDGADNVLLIVAENSYDFTFPERSFLRAFNYMPSPIDRTSLGIKLLSTPLPNISLQDFLSESMSMRDLNMLKQLQPTIYYQLPRKGTSIHALLVFNDELINRIRSKECGYDKKICRKMEKAYRYYQQKLKEKIYRDIELTWDGDQFTIGKRSPNEPRSQDIWPKK